MGTGLDALKTTSKKEAHKTGQFLGNKITDAVTKSNSNNTVKQEPVEETIVSPDERDKISN